MTFEKQKPGYIAARRVRSVAFRLRNGESHLTGHADGGTGRGIPGAWISVDYYHNVHKLRHGKST